MRTKYLILLIGMTLVTCLPRIIPLLLLSKMEIPNIVKRWLRYIPAAMLAALLAPGILMVEGKLELTRNNINLLAAIPTFLVASYKKNIFLTVVVGVLSVAVLRLFI